MLQLSSLSSSLAGSFSALVVGFSLTRQIGHYILDYYVPSVLLVIMSWVSFWLHPSAIPGRTTLGEKKFAIFFVSLKGPWSGKRPLDVLGCCSAFCSVVYSCSYFYAVGRSLTTEERVKHRHIRHLKKSTVVKGKTYGEEKEVKKIGFVSREALLLTRKGQKESSKFSEMTTHGHWGGVTGLPHAPPS